MSRFGHCLTDQEIASQLANLLNQHNQLSYRRDGESILQGRPFYLVETHGRQLLGAIGIDRQAYTLTEIKHLVVTPQWRKKGVGKFLVQRALRMVNTPLAYATIRKDNQASLGLFQGAGFARAGEYRAGKHQILLLMRVNERWTEEKGYSPTSVASIPPLSSLL